MIGGLASAKAFLILNKMEIEKVKLQIITEQFWNLATRMAQAETVNLELRKTRSSPAKTKLWKIKTEAVDLETCMKIGAIMGNGSESEVQHLGNYGRSIGTILGLWKDFHVAVNLTSELAEKIQNGALPYTLLWARERNEKLRKKLENMAKKTTIDPSDIKEIVGDFLETGALRKTVRATKKLSNKAVQALAKLIGTEATQTLTLLMEAQSQVLTESLSTLHA